MSSLRPLFCLCCCLAFGVQAQEVRFDLQVTGNTHWRLSVDNGAIAAGTRLALKDGQGNLVGTLDSAAATVSLPGAGTYQVLLEPAEAQSQVDVAITHPAAQAPCAAFRFVAAPAGISRLRALSSCAFRVQQPVPGGGYPHWTLGLQDEVPCTKALARPVPRL